jgi:carbon storage regulator
MLVLTRRMNEEIVMAGGLVRLVVVEIRGDKVRLGIEAPKEMSVHRREVYDRILAHGSIARLA